MTPWSLVPSGLGLCRLRGWASLEIFGDLWALKSHERSPGVSVLRSCRELGKKKFHNGYGWAYERTDEEGRSVKVTRHSHPNFRREDTLAGSP